MFQTLTKNLVLLVLVVYLGLGLIGLVGRLANPITKSFPRLAGVTEFCRAVGLDVKKLMDALGLMILGRTPTGTLEVLMALIKRLTTGAIILLVFSSCSAFPKDTTCPVFDKGVQHAKLALSLAGAACSELPCATEVDKAEKILGEGEATRDKACEAWPYLLTAASLAKDEKLSAAMKLGDVLLGCD